MSVWVGNSDRGRFSSEEGTVRQIAIGKTTVSGICIGGNPFSGFSHQAEERSREMRSYFTPERIKATLREAEAAGINTFCGRTDGHILGIVRDYWNEGGTIQWFAQVRGDDRADGWKQWMRAALELGCRGAYIHGGETDFWYANGLLDNLREALRMMRDGGVAAGFAGHKPEAHAWIRDNLDVDFHMCCHYNPTDRSKSPQHISVDEKWHEEDRRKMVRTISTIEKPVIHYKVFAGGNRPIVPAFEFLGSAMRPHDAACIGFFVKDDPDMITKDIALFEQYVDKTKQP